jgi:hypothetical protein
MEENLEEIGERRELKEDKNYINTKIMLIIIIDISL